MHSPIRNDYDVLVVGAGFAGSVVAERLAKLFSRRVLVIDQRTHVGGNAYDRENSDGILVHAYGPHIFHTNSSSVYEYLSLFTTWRPYEHRVLASVNNTFVPLPVNLTTINTLFGLALDNDGAKEFIEQRQESRATIKNSEDLILSRVGRELYDVIYRNYTMKQWGREPAQLAASVAGRLPVRFDNDDRYFTDTFQAMPSKGYECLFRAMLDHPLITVALNTSYRSIRSLVAAAHTVYTGPIDEFFDHRFGHLPYRSLSFKHVTFDYPEHQPVGVVNYPNEHEYTRVTEYKHLTGQRHSKTSVSFEFPKATGDPFYPIPCDESNHLYKRYKSLASTSHNVTFCGRLGNYQYFNMDQVIAQSLSVATLVEEKLRAPSAQ